MTATAIIYVALRLSRDGLKRPGRTASTEELADGLIRLNAMLDAWALERLTMFYLLRTVKLLGTGVASYTVGTGGDINIVRPTTVDYANLIIDTGATPTTEIPLEVLTPQRWTAISQKDRAGALVQAIYYDFNWSAGLARVYVFPVPTTCGPTQLVLYTPQALTGFLDLTTSYTFPPGYAEALQYQLALRLAPEFGGLTDPTSVLPLAAKALATVKRANIRPVEARVDSALLRTGSGFDYRSGEVR